MTPIVAFLAAAFTLTANSGEPYYDSKQVIVPDSSCEDPDWSVYTGFGYLQLSANEFVLNGPGPGGLLSRLDWEVRDALTYNLGVKRHLNDRVAIFGEAIVSLGADDTDMYDRDWIGAPRMTDISDHSDVNLSHYFQIDAGVDFVALETQKLDVNLRLGFRYTDVAMDAYGGGFRYSTDATTGVFFDDIGRFPDGDLSISYRQKIPGVYIAPSAEWRVTERTTFTVGGLAGVTFSAEDRDHHWARRTLFESEFESVGFYGANIGLDHKLTDCVSAYINGDYTRYSTAVGDVTDTAYGANAGQGFTPNGGAMNLGVWQVNTGIKIKF
ncbi:MAG: omptin family outer membrane protease [Verrucomicrobiales bacterium]|nr:omptin family outer membrane protease [Verrucomicrobiales bacterium]